MILRRSFLGKLVGLAAAAVGLRPKRREDIQPSTGYPDCDCGDVEPGEVVFEWPGVPITWGDCRFHLATKGGESRELRPGDLIYVAPDGTLSLHPP